MIFVQSIVSIYMKNGKITIHDIARMLNVSPSTVSRSLNGHPRISIATREAVQKIARKYNYQPNVIASYLRKGKSKTAGVIVPRINRVFFSNVIGGIEDILSTAGFTLTICQSDEQYDKEVANIKTLANLQVDGIIMSLATETTNHSHLEEFVNKGNKLVMFDRIAEGLKVDSVKVDDFSGAYQLVSHLIDQGYKRIAHFAGPLHINVYRDRHAGYMKALKDHGINPQEEYIFNNVLTKEKGIEATINLLSFKKPPDAVFAASDFSAIGALTTVKEKGIMIPRDMGIAGFANEPFTELVTPSLTSVDQKSIEMGRIIDSVFLDADESSREKKHETTQISLKPELIIRQSSNRKGNNYK